MMTSHTLQMLSATTEIPTDDEKYTEMSMFNNPRNYLNTEKKLQGCHQEMSEQNIDIRSCVDTREFCDQVMARYATLLDFATQIPSEHIQKEKEYGIIWRSAFKAEVAQLVRSLNVVKSLTIDENMEPLYILHEIVKKDCIDAANFDMKTQADLLCWMVENLDNLEKAVAQIKVMLKEPMPENFKEIKEKSLAQVQEGHNAFNKKTEDQE